MRLVDTAGIRTALDEAESIGVRKSVEAIADADIVLVVLDVSELTDGDFAPDAALLEKTQDRPRIVVCNKSDLLAVIAIGLRANYPSTAKVRPRFSRQL